MFYIYLYVYIFPLYHQIVQPIVVSVIPMRAARNVWMDIFSQQIKWSVVVSIISSKLRISFCFFLHVLSIYFEKSAFLNACVFLLPANENCNSGCTSCEKGFIHSEDRTCDGMYTKFLMRAISQYHLLSNIRK